MTKGLARTPNTDCYNVLKIPHERGYDFIWNFFNAYNIPTDIMHSL